VLNSRRSERPEIYDDYFAKRLDESFTLTEKSLRVKSSELNVPTSSRRVVRNEGYRHFKS